MATKSQAHVLVVQIGRYLLPLVFLGLAFHLLVPPITSLDHSIKIIQPMLSWVVALAVVAQALSYLSTGYLLG